MKYNGVEYFEGRTKAPCMNCKPHEGCHATCEAYKEFERIHAEERRQIHLAKHKHNLGYGAPFRSEKQLKHEAIARSKRKANRFKYGKETE